MTITTVQNKIIPTLKRQGVTKASVFGSFARGQAQKDSDIDILVELPKGKSLLDLVRLELELSKKLKLKVDLLTYNSIHPLLRKIILNEQKLIYAKDS